MLKFLSDIKSKTAEKISTVFFYLDVSFLATAATTTATVVIVVTAASPQNNEKNDDEATVVATE